MTVYYVDYENVHAGVDGIDKLTANDTVRIFYSPKADTMRIAFVEQALRAQAKIELISVDVGTPNALDFHLVAWLYSELPQATEEHVIVSNDHGYDAADRMGVRLGLPQVRRVSSIAEDLGLPPTPLAETAGKRRSSSRRGGKGRRGTADASAVDAPVEAAEAGEGAPAEGTAAGDGAPGDVAKAKASEGSEAAEVVAARSAEHVVEVAVSVAGESAPEMPTDSTPASEDAKSGEAAARANKRNGKSRRKKKSDKNDKGDKAEKATEQPTEKASEAQVAAEAPTAAEAPVAAGPADTATNVESAVESTGEAASSAVATEPVAAPEPATEPADQLTVEPAAEPAAEFAAAEPSAEAKPQVVAVEPASEPATAEPAPAIESVAEPAATEPAPESAPKQTRSRRRRRSAKSDAAKADAVSKTTALLAEREVTLPEDQLNVVVKAAQAATTKQEFYRGIIQKLGQKQGLVVYGQVKQLFKEISATVAVDTPES